MSRLRALPGERPVMDTDLEQADYERFRARSQQLAGEVRALVNDTGPGSIYSALTYSIATRAAEELERIAPGLDHERRIRRNADTTGSHDG